MIKRTLTISAVAFTFASIANAKIDCSIDAATDSYMCVDTAKVREKDGIRFADLYTGGPNQIRKSKYSVHTNCATKITHLKDRDGVSFAGGSSNATSTIKNISEWLCEATVKK